LHVFNLKGGWGTCHFFHQISIKFSDSEAGKKKIIIQKHPNPPNAIYDRGKYFYNQPLPGLLMCERDNHEAKPIPESAANPSQYPVKCETKSKRS
jgi:hypothetical protein